MLVELEGEQAAVTAEVELAAVLQPAETVERSIWLLKTSSLRGPPPPGPFGLPPPWPGGPPGPLAKAGVATSKRAQAISRATKVFNWLNAGIVVMCCCVSEAGLTVLNFESAFQID